LSVDICSIVVDEKTRQFALDVLGLLRCTQSSMWRHVAIGVVAAVIYYTVCIAHKIKQARLRDASNDGKKLYLQAW